MKTSSHISTHVLTHGKTLLAASITALLFTACASVPPKPEGLTEARNKLTQLENNPELAPRAPVAIQEAEVAVTAAERLPYDKDQTSFKVYMADRKVDIAIANAKTKLAEDQRAALSQQRNNARLAARTREADAANSRLETARGVIADQKRDVADANNQLAVAHDEMADQQRESDADADAARIAAANAAQQSAELQRQLDDMHVKATDRGLVLTLGDMLFTSGNANLKSGTTSNLNKLVTFLNNYPDRTVMIEGYTDSIGGNDYNMSLSQRRAESVRNYLADQGIGEARLTAVGNGESDPIASNGSAAGRQQNRRVEVIISKQAQLLSKAN